MVRVEPRTGGLFGWAGVVAWVALYVTAALSTPGYTIPRNRLSDLGNPAAPAHWAFDAACILAGIFFVPFLLAVGVRMSKWMARIGRSLMVPSAGFLILVGVFPEGSPYDLHFVVSAGFFILLMMGVSHYAIAMWRNACYGRLSGLLSVVASGLALFFVVAVALETVVGAQIAGGVVSNVLEHVTVFASLVWAAWTGWRLHLLGGPAEPVRSGADDA